MPRAGRTGRSLLTVVALVVILGALLVAADRVADHVAENRAAAKLQHRLHLSTAPTVRIEGFPFLTQLAGHSFGHVVITADNVAAHTDSGRLPLRHVELNLHQVRVRGLTTVTHIASLTGDLELTWAEVSRLSGRTIGFDHAGADGGWIKITGSGEVAGHRVDFTLAARPVVDRSGETITLADPKLSVLGGLELPDRVTQALIAPYVEGLRVPLPAGAKITGLAVQPDGVRVDLAARDVDLGG